IYFVFQYYLFSISFNHLEKNLFLCYGIQLDGIINGTRHAREVQGSKSESMPSKYPSHYRIDLHIDDDKSVLENSKIYGFRVYFIQEHDENWVENIINIITN
ncbi:MAG: HAD family hydrolase, partial [Oscillospiraceae bacterium]|nr:HAD family hydrolase [Oscillospiraceae bacterium]